MKLQGSMQLHDQRGCWSSELLLLDLLGSSWAWARYTAGLEALVRRTIGRMSGRRILLTDPVVEWLPCALS